MKYINILVNLTYIHSLMDSFFYFFWKHMFLNYCFGYHQLFILVNLTYITVSWNSFFYFFWKHTVGQAASHFVKHASTMFRNFLDWCNSPTGLVYQSRTAAERNNNPHKSSRNVLSGMTTTSGECFQKMLFLVSTMKLYIRQSYIYSLSHGTLFFFYLFLVTSQIYYQFMNVYG